MTYHFYRNRVLIQFPFCLGQGGGSFGGGGGSMGGGGYSPNGGNRYPNRPINFNDYWNDPSNRREVTLTVEFTVVDPERAGDREEHDPWIEVKYAANSRDESCQGASVCQDKWWWVQFTTADGGNHPSGLRKIDMDNSRPSNGGRPDFNHNDDKVYYRLVSYYSFKNSTYDFSSQRMLDLLFKIIHISILGTKNLRLEQMMRSRLLPELTVVINTCVSW